MVGCLFACGSCVWVARVCVCAGGRAGGGGGMVACMRARVSAYLRPRIEGEAVRVLWCAEERGVEEHVHAVSVERIGLLNTVLETSVGIECENRV